MANVFLASQAIASSQSEIIIDKTVRIAAIDDNMIAYISYAETKAIRAQLYTYNLANHEKKQISHLYDVFIDDLIYKNEEIVWWGESYSGTKSSSSTSDNASEKILVWLDANGKVKAQWDIAEGFKSATIWNGDIYIINVLTEVTKLEKNKPMPSLDLAKIARPERNGITRQIRFLNGPDEKLTYCNGPSGMKADDWVTYCYQVDENGNKNELTKVYSLYRAHRGVSNHPIFCGNDIFWLEHARKKYDLFHMELGAKEALKLAKFTSLPIMNCYNNELYLYSKEQDNYKTITGKSGTKQSNLFHHKNISSSITGNIWPARINHKLYDIELNEGILSINKSNIEIY